MKVFNNVIQNGGGKLFNMIDIIFNGMGAGNDTPNGVITWGKISQLDYEKIKNCEILESFFFYGASDENDGDRIPLTFYKGYEDGNNVYFSCIANINDNLALLAIKVNPTETLQAAYMINFPTIEQS